ncbi:Exocyst complex component S5, partial [Linderina macrospora]
MELVVNTANDIEAIDMAAEPAIILANLISQLKAGLILFLCELWDRDAQAMNLHETWQLHHGTAYWPAFYIARRDRSDRSGSPAELAETIANTELVPVFLRTAQTITQQLGTLHMAALQPRKGGRAQGTAAAAQFGAGFDEGQRVQGERSREMTELAVRHVKHTFFGTLYSFLDTLHVLAFSTLPPSEAAMQALSTALPYSVSSALSVQATGKRRQSFSLPAKKQQQQQQLGWAALAASSNALPGEASRALARHNTRSFYILATLCNLTAFRMFVIPDLLHAQAIRHTFKLDVGGSLPQLEKLFRRLDELVFGYYVRDRASQLSQIVRRGVLLGGVSWATHGMPRDSQPYVAEALLFLVFTHAELMDMIGEVGGAEHHSVRMQPLARRVFEKLTACLAQDLLENVRRVDVFSEGGMLQCVLEAMVVRRTLAEYLTPSALESFRLLHAY